MKNHWSNTKESLEFFFSYLENIKRKKRYNFNNLHGSHRASGHSCKQFDKQISTLGFFASVYEY